MGDSITEGTVQSLVKSKYTAPSPRDGAITWPFSPQCVGANLICLIEEGEYVQEDEVVAVIETDKVNVDIRSTHAGTIKKFYAQEGENVEVDSEFFEIDTEGKDTGAAQKGE